MVKRTADRKILYQTKIPKPRLDKWPTNQKTERAAVTPATKQPKKMGPMDKCSSITSHLVRILYPAAALKVSKPKRKLNSAAFFLCNPTR